MEQNKQNEWLKSHVVWEQDHCTSEVELQTWAFCFGCSVQASMAGSQDIVIDVQQAMVCIALFFNPGTICFEPQNTVPHGPCMQEAVTCSDS